MSEKHPEEHQESRARMNPEAAGMEAGGPQGPIPQPAGVGYGLHPAMLYGMPPPPQMLYGHLHGLPYGPLPPPAVFYGPPPLYRGMYGSAPLPGMVYGYPAVGGQPESGHHHPADNPGPHAHHHSHTGVLGKMLGEEAGILSELAQKLGMDDKEFWKGALVGAGVVLLLTNATVQGALFKTAARAKDTVASGAATVKAKVKAGVEAAKEAGRPETDSEEPGTAP